MNTFCRSHWFTPLLVFAASVTVVNPTTGRADEKPGSEHSKHGHSHRQKTPTVTNSIVEQLRELRTKVAKLEAALEKKHTGKAHASQLGHSGKEHSHGHSGAEGKTSGHGPGAEHGKQSAGKQVHGKSPMKTMGKSAMGEMMSSRMKSGMGMMQGGQHPGMNMMGRMKGMGQMTMASALPGFPGASHLYHIGATGFFLDHPQHITLSLDQKTKLNKIREDALLKQATFDRRIEDAEQELWVLTSADKPDATKIEAKIREIAQVGGDKRIAFIRAVGQAANILTDEQRKSLVGTLPDDHKAAGSKANGRPIPGKKGD